MNPFFTSDHAASRAVQQSDALDLGMKRDAMRYRFLREQVKSPATMVMAQALFWNNGSRGEFDKAVDELMRSLMLAALHAKPEDSVALDVTTIKGSK